MSKKSYNLDFEHSGSNSDEKKDVGLGDDMGKSGDQLDEKERTGGLSFGLAAFFMVAQMAGAGFLALPKAMSDAGWTGMVLIFVFCVSICFSGIRLGRCWVILEERWPKEYKNPVRQPYMEIAYRALGIWGKRLALFCVFFTLVGSTIVFTILIAELMNDMLPFLSQCQWIVIVGAFITPFTWLGSPKDFWQASVLAVIATAIAIVVIVIRIILDYSPEDAPFPDPEWPNPSIASFSLGFGAILFAFGGASVFPTIQNDMGDRSQFTKAAVLAFAVIGTMYVPVAFVGYYFIGAAVTSNILLSVESGIFVTIAICLQIVNLLGTFIISLSPVVQSIEDMLGFPSSFGWRRMVLRSTLIAFEVIVALAVPDFGLVLNLIGGSTITCLSFVFPPLCYMKLVDDKSDKTWPEWSIPTWQRIYLWCIAAVGVVGGISATITATISILSPESFGRSCFVNFDVKNVTEGLVGNYTDEVVLMTNFTKGDLVEYNVTSAVGF